MPISLLVMIPAFLAGVTPPVAQPAARPPAAGAAQDSLAALGWMAGCWQQRSGPRVTDEQWMRPAGNAMIGMSRTVAGDRVRAWEALRIVMDKGSVLYIAQPGGGPSTTFAASRLSDSLAVFENPAHDFPQRIAYRRITADSLVATISANREGKEQRMDIPMRRIACGP